MKPQLYSFDMDAIMGLNRQQLESVLRANEREMLELYDDNKLLREKIKRFEADIRHYEQRLKVLEEMKISQKASTGVWKAITVAMTAIGTMIGALFFKKDE